MAVDTTGFRSLVEQIQQRDRDSGEREDGRERSRRPAPSVAKAPPASRSEPVSSSARGTVRDSGLPDLLQRRWL